MKTEPNLSLSISKLRDLNAETWHDIIRLRSQVFVVEQKCIYADPDTIDCDSFHIIGRMNDKSVAYARLFRDKNWHIGRVVTDLAFRNRGLSRILMNFCLSFIKADRKGETIELSAQVYLSNFYSHLGFSPIGKVYLEDGIPHLSMRYQR